MSAWRESSAVVWRTGALGDFVLTLPVLAALRDRSEHLTVIAPARYRVLFESADRWIDSDGLEATRLLGGAALSAEIAVCWSELTARALRRSGVGRVRVGRALPPPGVHQADSLWEPLVPLLGPRDRDPHIPRAEPLHPGAVIAPGSGGVRKRWGLDRWHRVAAELPDALWIGGPQEDGEPGWGSPARFDLDLEGLVRLASGCRVWLGPDAGPQHLAAAVGARVGVLFTGRTDPVQWAPAGASVFDGADASQVARWAADHIVG